MVQRSIDDHDVRDLRTERRVRRVGQHRRIAQARGQFERTAGHVDPHQQFGPAAQRCKDIARTASQVDDDLAAPIAGGGQPAASEVFVAVAEIQIFLRPFRISEISGICRERF
jgi:poly-gamma-glutamate capsule biosynthesis protein CapA/YwtB (metallophosphatase superfamily)